MEATERKSKCPSMQCKQCTERDAVQSIRLWWWSLGHLFVGCWPPEKPAKNQRATTRVSKKRDKKLKITPTCQFVKPTHREDNNDNRG